MSETAPAVPLTVCRCCQEATDAIRRLPAGPTPICEACFGHCRPPALGVNWIRAASCPSYKLAAVAELDQAQGVVNPKDVREWLLGVFIGPPGAALQAVNMDANSEAAFATWWAVLAAVAREQSGGQLLHRLQAIGLGQVRELLFFRRPNLMAIQVTGPARAAAGDDLERAAKAAE